MSDSKNDRMCDWATDLQETLQHYGATDLEKRRRWYSPAAEAYNRVRPRYPHTLVQRVIDIAQLKADSTLLEVGCGPGTATASFAPLGCGITCLEPNPDFHRLAQRNSEPYPNVTVQNCAFEEWQEESPSFDAVLAASSFHWIPAEVGYPKAAAALRDGGYLILLWNKQLQPHPDVYAHLSEVYDRHAPSLNRYEDAAMQYQILEELGQGIVESGYFERAIAGHEWVNVPYAVEDYVSLLSTYSPYLKLEPQVKTALFDELSETIERISGPEIQLSHLVAFHVSKKARV